MRARGRETCLRIFTVAGPPLWIYGNNHKCFTSFTTWEIFTPVKSLITRLAVFLNSPKCRNVVVVHKLRYKINMELRRPYISNLLLKECSPNSQFLLLQCLFVQAKSVRKQCCLQIGLSCCLYLYLPDIPFWGKNHKNVVSLLGMPPSQGQTEGGMGEPAGSSCSTYNRLSINW